MIETTLLRQKILDLAIQGKLVEQRPDEGTAEDLYTQIQAEKTALIKAGKLKKDKPLPEITADELPFDIPPTWKWVRLGECGDYRKGPFGSALTKSMFVPKGEKTIKVYEQKNAIQKDATLGSYYIDEDYFKEKMSSFEVLPGDVIVSCAGTIGETYVMPDGIEQGIINQALMRMRLLSSIHVPYFLVFFDFMLKKSARSESKGSAIKNIPPFDVFKQYLIPLPPLAEQQRIVEKVEALMTQVEVIEATTVELERTASLTREKLLTLAIQGKLVEQRPNEGAAEALYAQIQAEKTALIKAGKLKKDKPLPEITADELPFDIPPTWKWVRLGECTNYAQSKEKVKGDAIEPTMWSLDLEDIEKDTGLVIQRILASERVIKGDKVRFYKGQVLYSKLRPYLKKVLVAPEDGVCSSEIVPFSSYVGIDANFLVYVLTSPYVDFVINSVTYGVKMPRVGTETMVNLLIPLPPLAEQQRIVERLEQLLALTQQLC